MKTLKITLVFLMALPFLFVSCKKELSGPTVTSNSITPTDQTAGAIVDLGVINADVHHMIVSLNDVSLTLTGQPVATGVESSKINIDLYANADGIIPDGTYTFSSDNNYAPFTFKSATILMPTGESNNTQSFSLNGGSISLTRSGISYSISMDGSLETGNNFQGNFNGALAYSDAVQNY
jgi:hypothetical protein